MKPELGEKIKKVRLRYGMSYRQFGEVIGKKSETVKSYEENRTIPDFATLVEISELFDVSVLYLMGLEDTLKEPMTQAEINDVTKLMTTPIDDVNSLRQGGLSSAELMRLYATFYLNDGENEA